MMDSEADLLRKFTWWQCQVGEVIELFEISLSSRVHFLGQGLRS